MKKYLGIFFMILLLPACVFPQALQLKGLILDAETSLPIPFATIGIASKEIGTVTDEEGTFKVALVNINSDDIDKIEVVFSCVGYQTLNLNVKELILNKDMIVRLQPRVFEINAVVVNPRKHKEKVYGNKNRAKLTSLGIFNRYNNADDALGKEVGRIIKIDNDIKLQEFGFYVYGSAFKSVKFRLNLYDCSESIPRRIDLEQDVIVDVDIPKGWSTIDLRAYNIHLKDIEKLGVTIQWLKSVNDSTASSNSSNFFGLPVGPISLNNIMIKEKSESDWSFTKGNLTMYVKALAYKNH